MITIYNHGYFFLRITFDNRNILSLILYPLNYVFSIISYFVS